MYWKDLAILAQKIGFSPPRLVSANIITIQNKELENMVGDCRFASATFRLFKVPETGPMQKCQVIYNGRIIGHEKELVFDANFTFKEGEASEVDGHTAAILKNSRFAPDFQFGPSEQKPAACRGGAGLQAEDLISDPFKLAEDPDKFKSRCPANMTSSCCGKNKSC